MSRRTIVTHPDGTTTTITNQGGCCAGATTLLALIVVLAVPAAYFPAPLAVLAYLTLAALLIAAVVNKAKGIT